MQLYKVTVKFFCAASGESYTEDLFVEAANAEDARGCAMDEVYDDGEPPYGYEASAEFVVAS